MGLTLLVSAALVLVVDIALVRRRRIASCRPGAVTAGGQVPARLHQRPSPAVRGGDVERTLAAQLLAGRLDPMMYRDALGAVAATCERHSAPSPSDPRLLLALDTGGLRRLDELGVALPDLPPDTLRAAVTLARGGADADDLTRLLGVPAPQALRITGPARPLSSP